MWTAILATLNLVDGTEYDVWSVNTEAEYHEEGEPSTPSSMSTSSADAGRRSPSSSARTGARGSVEAASPRSSRRRRCEVIVCERATARSCPSSGATGSTPRRARSSPDDLADAAGGGWLERSPCRGDATRSAARSSRATVCASRLGRVLLPLRARHAALRGARDASTSRRQRRLQARCARRDARRLPRRLLGARGAPRAPGARAPVVALARARRLPGPLGRVRRVHAPAARSRPRVRPSARRALLARAQPRRVPARRVVPIVLLATDVSRGLLAAPAAPRSLLATPLLLAYDVAWAAGRRPGIWIACAADERAELSVVVASVNGFPYSGAVSTRSPSALRAPRSSSPTRRTRQTRARVRKAGRPSSCSRSTSRGPSPSSARQGSSPLARR